MNIDPVAFDNVVHLCSHVFHELFALLLDHLARHLELVFFGLHDRAQHSTAVLRLSYPLLVRIIWQKAPVDGTLACLTWDGSGVRVEVVAAVREARLL